MLPLTPKATHSTHHSPKTQPRLVQTTSQQQVTNLTLPGGSKKASHDKTTAKTPDWSIQIQPHLSMRYSSHNTQLHTGKQDTSTHCCIQVNGTALTYNHATRCRLNNRHQAHGRQLAINRCAKTLGNIQPDMQG